MPFLLFFLCALLITPLSFTALRVPDTSSLPCKSPNQPSPQSYSRPGMRRLAATPRMTAVPLHALTFELIKPLLSHDIIEHVNWLKKTHANHEMLFSGATEEDFKLIINCISQETGYKIRYCSAHDIESVASELSETANPTIIIINHLADIDPDQAKLLYHHLSLQKDRINKNCIVGWIPDHIELTEDIQNFFNSSCELSLPTTEQRIYIFKTIIDQCMSIFNDRDIQLLVQKTDKWSVTQMLTLIHNSIKNNALHGKWLTISEQFEKVYQAMLKAKESSRNAILAAASIEYTKPETTFAQLSGHTPKNAFDVKRTIKRNGYHPGILFHGPPGTGKTSIAEAIAVDVGWKYVHCDGSSFASSMQEGSVLRFKKAIQAIQESGEPTVLCIDECGALFNVPNHNASTSHEPLLAYLRTLTQRCNTNKLKVPLLIIATTNDIQKIDPALTNRFSGETYKIMNPPKEIKRAIIIKLMSKVTNDDSVGTTRKALIEELLKYSKGLSLRPLSRIMEKAKELTLNNYQKTITDRYFFEALKMALLERACQGVTSSNKQVISTSITAEIQRDALSTIADDFENNLELKTWMVIALSLPLISSGAKYIKMFSPHIWYSNAMHVSQLELEAIKKELKETKGTNKDSIDRQKELLPKENSLLLLHIKSQIYKMIAEQDTITQNELLAALEEPLNQIKTRIGVQAYDDIIKQISNYYQNI